MLLMKFNIFLIQSSAPCLRNQLLGCLSDLLENPKSLPHFASWRGKNLISVSSLLCQFWREEESHLGVPKQISGLITESGEPLVGTHQAHQCVLLYHHAKMPSNSIVEVDENLRATIFGIFSRIGFDNAPGLEKSDLITLAVIEYYFDLKLGEVWKEFLSELEAENVVATVEDKEAIDLVVSGINSRSCQLLNLQTEMKSNMDNETAQLDQCYYNEVKSRYYQKQFDEYLMRKFMLRTKCHCELVGAKAAQVNAIENSRCCKTFHAENHPSDLPTLNTTVFNIRNVSVENPKTLSGEEILSCYKCKDATCDYIDDQE